MGSFGCYSAFFVYPCYTLPYGYWYKCRSCISSVAYLGGYRLCVIQESDSEKVVSGAGNVCLHYTGDGMDIAKGDTLIVK